MYEVMQWTSSTRTADTGLCVHCSRLLWDSYLHTYVRTYTHRISQAQGVSPFCGATAPAPVCTYIPYLTCYCSCVVQCWSMCVTNCVCACACVRGCGVIFTYVGVVGIHSWWKELYTYCAHVHAYLRMYVRTYACAWVLINVVVRYGGGTTAT